MPGASGQLKKLYQQILGAVAPSGAASDTGDISQMVKYLVARAKETVGGDDISPTAAANGSLAERVAFIQNALSGSVGIVSHPMFWAGGAGYEYWFGPASTTDLVIAAAATNPSGLDGWGWTMTGSFGNVVNGSGGDFLSAADPGTPVMSIIVTSASAQHLWSPQRFGDYNDALIAERFLGYFPTKLSVEFVAQFSTANNNEPGLFFGIAAGAPVLADASGSLACIYSNGTNFVCTGDTNSDVGAAVDTSPHRYLIEVTTGQVEWFIDGVSQGTFVPDTDTWPQAVGVRRAASLSNQLRMGQIRVRYS